MSSILSLTLLLQRFHLVPNLMRWRSLCSRQTHKFTLMFQVVSVEVSVRATDLLQALACVKVRPSALHRGWKYINVFSVFYRFNWNVVLCVPYWGRYTDVIAARRFVLSKHHKTLSCDRITLSKVYLMCHCQHKTIS